MHRNCRTCKDNSGIQLPRGKISATSYLDTLNNDNGHHHEEQGEDAEHHPNVDQLHVGRVRDGRINLDIGKQI